MKDITSVESLTVPEGVTCTIKARNITIEGPRGSLTKRVGHVQIDVQLVSFVGIGLVWTLDIGRGLPSVFYVGCWDYEGMGRGG